MFVFSTLCIEVFITGKIFTKYSASHVLMRWKYTCHYYDTTNFNIYLILRMYIFPSHRKFFYGSLKNIFWGEKIFSFHERFNKYFSFILFCPRSGSQRGSSLSATKWSSLKNTVVYSIHRNKYDFLCLRHKKNTIELKESRREFDNIHSEIS